MLQNHLRLSELTDKISETISSNFAGMKFWIVADVTNHTYNIEKKSHYFQLIEKSNVSNVILAKISGKAFGNGSVQLSEFEKNTGQKFTNNLSVLLLVSVEYHSVFGISLSVVNIDSNFSLGLIEKLRMETLLRLITKNNYISKKDENYVTTNNQLKLNHVIQKIAVISSINSAGNEDFRHTLSANNFGYKFEIDDYFTNVQGEINAKLFLQTLISIFQSDKPYDAVVITRGGGAQTDFLLFDDYQICRAVAKFPIPIITGIGHHKNVSLIDLMAHSNTKTPTKAAEYIIAHNRNFEEKLLLLKNRIVEKASKLIGIRTKEILITQNAFINNSKSILAKSYLRVHHTNQKFIYTANNLLLFKRKLLTEIATSLQAKPEKIFKSKSDLLNHFSKMVKADTIRVQKNYSKSIQHYEQIIKLISPENILKKGYSIVKFNGKIIHDSETVNVDDTIEVYFSNFKLDANITQKNIINENENDL